MAIFQYKGFDNSGKEVNGHIEANNAKMAQYKLRLQQIYASDIREDSAKRDRTLFPFLSKILYKISRKEIGFFANQLGTLLGAGISIDNALKDLFDQTTNINLKKVIGQMRESVIQGKKLSEAFAEHPQVFPPVYEHMIRVGEAAGTFEKTLQNLAELEEKNAELKGKVSSAMIYPAIMMGVAIAVVMFLLVAVVPQIKNLFANLNKTLPLSTQIVIFMSELTQKYWPYFVVLLGGAVTWFNFYRQKIAGKTKLDEIFLKLPILGLLSKKIQVSQFSRNLGTLLEANVGLLEGLNITSQTVTNEVFRGELKKAAETIKEGSSIKVALQNSSIISDMAKGMLAAGESTDRLQEMLLKIAYLTESEVNTTIKKLTNALEPVIMIFMGVIVFFIMASVMTPIYNLSKQLR